MEMSTRTHCAARPTQSPPAKRSDVVVVGGGMAGLTCIRRLLLWNAAASPHSAFDLHVTLLEASDCVGGRVQATTKNNLRVDAGAEFVHGRGHLLWDTIQDFQTRGLLPTTAASDEKEATSAKFEFPGLEPQFILSHADGGPEEAPTLQGKYGMYYINGELVRFDDERVQPLKNALNMAMAAEMLSSYTDQTSLEDVLTREENNMPKLSETLMKLCVSGYGNTAGCCDLKDLSIKQLMAFEHYWEENEVEGDFRLSCGMFRIVEAMMKDIQMIAAKNTHVTLTVNLNTPVDRIKLSNHSSTNDAKIILSCGTEKDDSIREFLADVVVLTVPPTRLPQLFDGGKDLSASKREALERIGFADRVVKVICAFRCSFWPINLQSVISTDEEPIPEIWFRPYKVNHKPSNNAMSIDVTTDNGSNEEDNIFPDFLGESSTTSCYLAVGYLVSTAADRFMDSIHDMQKKKKAEKEQERKQEHQGNMQDDKEEECQQEDEDSIIRSRDECGSMIMMQQLSNMFSVSMKEIQESRISSLCTVVDWKDDFPYVQGGYVYAKTGMKVGHDLEALAEPMWEGRLVFAGEATNTNACCTVQSAMETGLRAADEVFARLSPFPSVKESC